MKTSSPSLRILLSSTLALSSLAATLQAGARTSASYTIATDTADAGGRRATSASYTNDGSAGGVVGISIVATPAETAKHGYVGQPPNANAGPLADPDRDGQTNAFEYTAGLFPNNANSVFRLRLEAVPAQPGQKRVIFSPRLTDRTYVVNAKPSLLTGTFTALGSSSFTDAAQERTVTDLNATGATKFDQVEITKP